MKHTYFYTQKGKLNPVTSVTDEALVRTEGMPLKKSLSHVDFECSCGSRTCRLFGSRQLPLNFVKEAMVRVGCDVIITLNNPHVEVIERGFLSTVRVNLGDMGLNQ
jgi:hypothetical protein